MHQSLLPDSARQSIRRTAPRMLILASMTGLTACQQEHLNQSPSQPATAPAPPPAQASTATGPNIVFIITDDQELASMSVMPRTVELIGAAGVTFENYVLTQGLCCPSRATFLTGQYPHNHGVRSNAPPDGGHTQLDHSNTLPVWLQAAGYVTGYIGKYLNGYGRVNQLEVVPGWTEWFLSTNTTDAHYFTYVLNENGTIVSYGTAPEHYKTDVFTDKAVDFINRRAPDAAAGGAPFFLFVSYFAPHGGNPREPGDPTVTGTPVPAPRHKGHFAGVTLVRPPSFNEADVGDKPLSIRRLPRLTLSEVRGLDNAHGQRLESLLSVDEGVDRIVGALQAQNVLENTLIIFTSDNGWFQGQHRIKRGKDLPYEAAVRVPLLIRGPGIVAGLRIPAPVANIDLAPTMVEAARTTAGRTMDGRSLYPFLNGERSLWLTGNGPRHLLVEHSQLGPAETVFWSIRRGNYVYTEWANGDRELYNLGSDPDQLRSRHADPTQATVRRQLARRLAAMKTCVGPIACW